MADPFAITTTTNSVQLGAKRQGTVTFTVFNASGRPLRGQSRIVPQNLAAAPWLTLAGESQRDLPIGGTQQYIVNIAVPSAAAVGNYSFQLSLSEVSNPDDVFSIGPSVTFEVPAPVPVRRPFPWWIPIVAVVAVVLVGGAITYFLSSGNSQNSNATHTADALVANQATALAALNVTSTAQVSGTSTAMAQLNSGTQTALANSTATVQAQASQTAVFEQAAKTVIAQITATAVASANTDTRVAAAKATETAIFNGIQYTGTWLNDKVIPSAAAGAITQLDISAAPNRSLSIHGINRNAPADMGTSVAAYTGGPVSIFFTRTIDIAFTVVNAPVQLTLSLDSTNSKLTVVEVWGLTAGGQSTAISTFSRKLSIASVIANNPQVLQGVQNLIGTPKP